MIDLKITDVRAVPGDSAFLIDDGKTAILYDSGFGFTGDKIAENIKKQLGDRNLDFIFLTHSHYDHALASAYVLDAYPNAKVVAGSYATKIFAKPTARAVMMDLDKKFATKCGVENYRDLSENLRVDIPVEHNDIITCGDMKFRAIALPGHTRCSIGFYLEENRLLLANETLGVYFGDGRYLSAYLVGYEMTLNSFKEAKKLAIDSVLIAHYGLLQNDEAKSFLETSEKNAVATAEKVLSMLRSGLSKEEIVEQYTKEVYDEKVSIIYPIDAFKLNTSIMVDLLKREFLEE